MFSKMGWIDKLLVHYKSIIHPDCKSIYSFMWKKIYSKLLTIFEQYIYYFNNANLNLLLCIFFQ